MHETVTCPECGATVFALLRSEAGVVFGVTCQECGHSYNLTRDVQEAAHS